MVTLTALKDVEVETLIGSALLDKSYLQSLFHDRPLAGNTRRLSEIFSVI